MKVLLDLEPHQIMKLHKGHSIQLKHPQLLVEGKHFVIIHHSKGKKIHHAHKHHKGVRLQMTEPEIHETIEGGGFGDFLNKLKQGGQWLKKNIVDSDIYQKYAKPVVRQIVNTGLDLATPHLGAAAPLARQAVDAIGSKTNAYGIKAKRHAGLRTKVVHPRFDEHEMQEFIAESMVAPTPGHHNGFIALPSSSYGNGLNAHHHYHHYYYPHDHGHLVRGGSFRLG